MSFFSTNTADSGEARRTPSDPSADGFAVALSEADPGALVGGAFSEKEAPADGDASFEYKPKDTRYLTSVEVTHSGGSGSMTFGINIFQEGAASYAPYTEFDSSVVGSGRLETAGASVEVPMLVKLTKEDTVYINANEVTTTDPVNVTVRLTTHRTAMTVGVL